MKYNKRVAKKGGKTLRIGRPPADNPRSIQTRIRMTKEEATMLDTCASKLNTTKTEVVIKGIEKVYKELEEKKMKTLRDIYDGWNDEGRVVTPAEYADGAFDIILSDKDEMIIIDVAKDIEKLAANGVIRFSTDYAVLDKVLE